MALTHQDALRNTLCSTVTGRVDAGSANPKGRVVFFDALNNPVAIIGLSLPAFQAPIAGIAMANTTTPDTTPVAGATPVRYEVQDRDGVWIFRDAVGPSASLGAPGTPIPAGAPAVLTNLFYRAPL